MRTPHSYSRRTFQLGLAVGLFATLTSLGWAGPVGARTFYVLRTLGDAWMIVDPTGIETGDAATQKRMWTVTVQPNILNETPPQPGYVRALNEFDCATQKTRWRSFTVFSRSGGRLMDRENASPEWVDTTAGSSTLVEWRVACGYSTGDSAISADSTAQVVIALMRAWDPPAAVVVAAPPVAAPKTAAPKLRPVSPAKPKPGPKLAPTKPK